MKLNPTPEWLVVDVAQDVQRLDDGVRVARQDEPVWTSNTPR